MVLNPLFFVCALVAGFDVTAHHRVLGGCWGVVVSGGWGCVGVLGCWGVEVLVLGCWGVGWGVGAECEGVGAELKDGWPTCLPWIRPYQP